MAGPRMLSVGSGGQDGLLILTPVTTGQVTRTSFEVKNTSKQTLTAVTLLGGSSATPDATEPSLPVGASYLSVVDSAGKCQPRDDDPGTVAVDYRGFTCPFGNLARGSAAITVTILIQTQASNVGSPDFPLPDGDGVPVFVTWVEATFNEAGNDQPPTNPDTFGARGQTPFHTTDKDHTATFSTQTTGTIVVSTGIANSDLCLTTVAGCNGQGAQVVVPATSNGRAISIEEFFSSATQAACVDAGISSCFGEDFLFRIDGGVQIVPSYDATLRWAGNKTIHGVIKFASPTNLSNPLIITKNATCGKKLVINCVVSVTQDSITLRLDRNGPAKGW
jgi:hypothetical protein